MKKSGIIFAIIAVILIALISIGAFYITKPNNEEEKNTKSEEIITNTNKETNTKEITNNKSAVIFFSATGTTKQIAEYIKSETNSDLFEIIPKQKYTSEDLNYGDNNTRATREQRDSTARPEIQNKIDVSNYDTIFLGYPIWWGDVPKIILSFIDETNLNGKTIIPFCTSGSTDISGSKNTLKTYNSSINWVLGKRFSNNSTKEDIKDWIQKLNISKVEKKDNQVINVGETNNMSEFIIEVKNKDLIVKVEENSSSKALLEKLKNGNIVVNASDYNNFEKVGELGFDLPRNDKQITTKPGDVILYQGNNICLYYNTNSWNFTKLGEVTNVDSTELKSVLGIGNITMTLKLKK